MKPTLVAGLGLLLALSSCSTPSFKAPSLAKVDLYQLNPFRSRLPIREVTEADLAMMEDFTIASHTARGMPPVSSRPVDFSPPGLPVGFDLLEASLLPPKNVGLLRPIVPHELLDEPDQADAAATLELPEQAPLVPEAPESIELSAVE